jgi:plasmid maintenance system antidote protein VapI
MQIISIATAETIKKNWVVNGRLVAAFKVHPRTIENWINCRDIRLTTPTAIQIIKEETGLQDNQIFEETIESDFGNNKI